MGDETSASSVKNIFAAFLSVILRFHVPGYFVDFQFADLLTFWNAMILEELAVGEDQRALAAKILSFALLMACVSVLISFL